MVRCPAYHALSSYIHCKLLLLLLLLYGWRESDVETKLQKELTTIKPFSDDIRMEFGLDKCAMEVSKHGKLTKSQNASRNN
jgi:hypothetical protein